jgi:hypothetical protein
MRSDSVVSSAWPAWSRPTTRSSTAYTCPCRARPGAGRGRARVRPTPSPSRAAARDERVTLQDLDRLERRSTLGVAASSTSSQRWRGRAGARARDRRRRALDVPRSQVAQHEPSRAPAAVSARRRARAPRPSSELPVRTAISIASEPSEKDALQSPRDDRWSRPAARASALRVHARPPRAQPPRRALRPEEELVHDAPETLAISGRPR